MKEQNKTQEIVGSYIAQSFQGLERIVLNIQIRLCVVQAYDLVIVKD